MTPFQPLTPDLGKLMLYQEALSQAKLITKCCSYKYAFSIL